MSGSSARALSILDQVARSGHPLGVTEIARALSLPPGTVFRSLDALLRAGLVARYRASARYVPGPAAERLHRNVISRFAAREVCLPYLRQLASISGETASLHLRVGWYAVRICSVPGTGEVMTLPPIGEAEILAKSCAGQAILASLPRSEMAKYRAWAKKRGEKIQMTPDQIARRGFAASDGATAFPVRAAGVVVAAIRVECRFAVAERDGQLRACRNVMSNLDALASAQSSLFANPFSHLHPDTITL